MHQAAEEAAKAAEAAAEADGTAPKKRRRSRWEEKEEPGNQLAKLTPGGVPEFMTLPGGIVVRGTHLSCPRFPATSSL